VRDWVTAKGGQWKSDDFLKDKITELFAKSGDPKKTLPRKAK
jgi:hypothetical protein